MLFDLDFLQRECDRVINKRKPSIFFQEAVPRLCSWLEADPSLWMAFGPYWAVIAKLIKTYNPTWRQVNEWNHGTAAPDYLSRYDTGNDALNWTAALTYLNRDGDYFSHPEQPHSIVLPDDSYALYTPGVGIHES